MVFKHYRIPTIERLTIGKIHVLSEQNTEELEVMVGLRRGGGHGGVKAMLHKD